MDSVDHVCQHIFIQPAPFVDSYCMKCRIPEETLAEIIEKEIDEWEEVDGQQED